MIAQETKTETGQHAYEAMNGSLEWANRSRVYELDSKLDLAVWAKLISWAMKNFYEAS